MTQPISQFNIQVTFSFLRCLNWDFNWGCNTSKKHQQLKQQPIACNRRNFCVNHLSFRRQPSTPPWPYATQLRQLWVAGTTHWCVTARNKCHRALCVARQLSASPVCVNDEYLCRAPTQDLKCHLRWFQLRMLVGVLSSFYFLGNSWLHFLWHFITGYSRVLTLILPSSIG